MSYTPYSTLPYIYAVYIKRHDINAICNTLYALCHAIYILLLRPNALKFLNLV